MKKIILLMIITMLLVSCDRANSITIVKKIYISSEKGHDENNGSIDSPIKTIKHLNTIELNPGDQVLFESGNSFRGQLLPKSGAVTSDVLYGAYGEGEKPIILGSVMKNDKKDWFHYQDNIYVTDVKLDVGNVIVDHLFGVKKWRMTDLSKANDYFYEDEELYMFADTNPTYVYTTIELALTRDIINQSNCSFITYDCLSLKYGGAYGIAGGDTSNLTIRNMDISYIGGGFLYKDGKVNIQYGNGIELWGNARNHLVENNYIDNIFDSGVTNQNNFRKAIQENITYRNNAISNCGMASSEFDNAPQSGLTQNILFEDNHCKNVGLGWSVTQDRYLNSNIN